MSRESAGLFIDASILSCHQKAISYTQSLKTQDVLNKLDIFTDVLYGRRQDMLFLVVGG